MFLTFPLVLYNYLSTTGVVFSFLFFSFIFISELGMGISVGNCDKFEVDLLVMFVKKLYIFFYFAWLAFLFG